MPYVLRLAHVPDDAGVEYDTMEDLLRVRSGFKLDAKGRLVWAFGSGSHPFIVKGRIAATALWEEYPETEEEE